jgi:hypothetical protein
MNRPATGAARPQDQFPPDFPQFPEPGDSRKPDKPGALLGNLSMILAGLWVVGFAAGALVLMGPDRMSRLSVLEILALIGCSLGPAVMVWFTGAAAREGVHARNEARRLADAADRLMKPHESAIDSGRRLADSLRDEVAVLDRALDQTLSRLADIQGVISGQVQAVNQMAAMAKSGAGRMISGMERERAELLKISQDLTTQSQLIGDSISRHTRSIAESTKQVETELRSADNALDNRMSSFGAAAALITDRTQALTSAAQASADSALRLETALSNALDVLAKATNLTEAARQSADDAAGAANATADTVHHSSGRAVEEAKRAAEIIRAEAASIEREAAAAMERLREAAEAAHEAAASARQAADENARSGRAMRTAAYAQRPPEPPPERPIERNHSADLAPPGWRVDPPAPRPRRGQEPPPRREPPQSFDRDVRRAPRAPEPRPEPEIHLEDEPAERPNGNGAWTWRELLSNIDEGQGASAPPRRNPADDPVARLAQSVGGGARNGHAAASSAPIQVAHVIEEAGLRLPDVFSASGLDRISQRSRSGTQARRRAVTDAAPDAVRRLREHLSRADSANQQALEFLRADGARIADLLARGRAAMSADATRAFLLIDAAAS